MVKHVLVVDDNPAVALAMKVVFRTDGRFAVGASAATAGEGLERLAGQDAVLLDLRLPDAEGPAVVRAFRERAPDVPIIIHSAADETPEVEAVRDLVDAVVLKSRVDEVLDTLARLTGQ